MGTINGDNTVTCTCGVCNQAYTSKNMNSRCPNGCVYSWEIEDSPVDKNFKAECAICEELRKEKKSKDNWKHRNKGMSCKTCMWFVPKAFGEDQTGNPTFTRNDEVGRCRKRAPSMSGWPVMFKTDWCGDHKLYENKI